MKNSQLIAVLKTLTKKEIRELRKWLQSPIHNQREDVVNLFGYLTSGSHLENEKYIQKDRVFKKIFLSEKFDDAKIRQTVHFLLKSVEEYLVIQEQNEDLVNSKIALAKVYRKRKLDKTFQRIISSLEKDVSMVPFQDANFLRNSYLIHHEKYSFNEGKKRTSQLNLQELSDSLDIAYMAEKLRKSCFMIAHQKVYKTEYQIGLLDEVLEYVNKEKFLKIPAIAIYYYGFKAFTANENSDYFEKLKNAIVESGHLFPLQESRDIYLMAINYCISKLNIGERKYMREAFELYRQGFDAQILIENNNISRWTFMNVITIAIRLKEFKWAEKFIQDNKKYLDEVYRESIVCYGLAILHYEQKDYAKSMMLLNQVEYDDILISLNSKWMLVRMYYEEGEFDALESLLESMRNYMHRKKVIGYHKNSYTNVIKYTRKLLRVPPDSVQKEKLRKEIEVANPLSEKQWLLQQLDNL